MNRKPMLKKDESGNLILSYVFDDARQHMTLRYQAARNAYNGIPDDITEFVVGWGAINKQKKGYESLAAWLDRALMWTNRPDRELPGKIAREYMLTPTVMERVMNRKGNHQYLELKPRKGGWGGARKGAGGSYVPPAEKLAELEKWRQIYVEKAAESWSMQPYKTFESIWESVYHKKASKRLLSQFAEDVNNIQKGR